MLAGHNNNNIDKQQARLEAKTAGHHAQPEER